MATANSMEFALKIKADAKQAVDAMQQVRAEMDKTADAAKRASTGSGALGSSTSTTATAMKTATDAAAKHAAELTDVAYAASNTAKGADALGRSIGNMTARLATGNISGATRDVQKLGSVAVQAGLGAGLLGVAVLGSAAALAVLALAFVKGRGEATAFNNALILTGGYSGQSVASLEALSMQLDNLSGVTEHAAAAVIAQVAATGRFYGTQVGMVATAALQMQQATGQSIDATIKQFEALGENPVQSILALDRTMHFLTQSVYDQMTALVQQGQEEQAAEVGQQALADAIAKRTAAVSENVGILQSMWRGLKNAAKEAWDAMLNIGRSDDGVNLQIWQQQLDTARKNLAQPGLNDATIRIFMSQANEAQAQIDKLSGKTAQDAKQVSDALAAQQALAQAGITPLKTYLGTVAKLTQQYKTAIVGADAATKATALENLQNAIAKAQKTYDAATREPKGPKPPKPRVDHSQEILDRQAAAAQDALTQSLIAQQAALSPTAAIWAKYNQTVKDATDKANLAKQATGANAASIDGIREGVIAAAAAVRDAALDKQAEQARQQWEALKRSFATPAEVRMDDALKQIQQLNDLLDQGVISAQEYHDSLGKVAVKAVGDAPQYQGLDAAVGGIGSELRKNYDAMARLEAWHQQAMQENEKFRQGDLASEEAYQVGLANIQQKYAAQRNRIEQDRGQLQLQTASDIFGQLATLSRSHNKKIAAIGKAAAIAKAVIDTYSSANAAYNAMASIPVVGPALGIAAAAAAIAAGMANVAQIRSQDTGAYAEGGHIRGPGTGTSDSILMWGSNGEFMQREAAVRYYGLDFMNAVNDLRLPKLALAQGGPVGAPSPAQLGFSMPASPRMDFASLAAANDSGQDTRQAPVPKVLVFFDKEAVMDELANTRGFEKASVHVVGNNPTAIQSSWGR